MQSKVTTGRGPHPIAIATPTEYEEQILGASMVSEAAFETARASLKPHQFSMPRNQVIWAAMLSLGEEGAPVSDGGLTVGKYIEKIGKADQVGGRHFVAALPGKANSAPNTRHYVSKVLEAWRLRRAHDLGHRLAGLTEANGECTAVRDELSALLGEVATESVPASTLTSFSDIVARPVRWLMQDYIALGKLTALAGRPKIGKGLWYSRLIADVTRGRLRGDLSGPAPAIIVTTEDEPGDTLKPRLMAAGADLDLVSIFQMGSKDEPVPFRVPQDAEELTRRVEETGAQLVVVDPLLEFIDGKTDTHKSQASRHAISAVNEIARSTGCAMLTIFHLNKGASTDPLLRHEGSAAFTQVVRAGLMLGFDPEDPDGEEGDRRVLAVSSSNLAKLAPSLVYRIEGATVTGDTDEPITTAAMHHIGESGTAAHELLGGGGSEEEKADRDEATEFLLAELEDGPRRAGEVQTAAKGAGIGPGALKRAKRELRVEKDREGFGGKGFWVWTLPKGDGTKGTDHVPEKPSPLSPLASRAKYEGPKGDEIPKGDGLGDGSPLGRDVDRMADAERVAEKFGEAI